jgi:hypothetical protein
MGFLFLATWPKISSVKPVHVYKEMPAFEAKEMAKPRMAKSAKITELNLDTARIPEQPSTTIPGTVHKIIPSPRPGQPEEAQIAVDDGDHRHRDLRIENTLTDENGDYVRLKKGAHVQITVTAEPKNASADAKKRANG